MAYECCIGDNALPSRYTQRTGTVNTQLLSSDTLLVCARSNRHSPAYHSPGPPSRQRRVVLERQFPGGLAARRDSPSLKVLPQTDLERSTRASEKRRCGTDTLRLRAHVHTHTHSCLATHARRLSQKSVESTCIADTRFVRWDKISLYEHVDHGPRTTRPRLQSVSRRLQPPQL